MVSSLNFLDQIIKLLIEASDGNQVMDTHIAKNNEF